MISDTGTTRVATDGAATARALYEAFGRGDITTVLGMFDDGIEWRLAEGHPYRPDGSAWVGPQAVLTELFARLAQDFDGLTVQPHIITSTSEGALVQGRYAGTVKATGRRLEAQFCHVLQLRDGRVTHFQQYLDTSTLQWAMGHTPVR